MPDALVALRYIQTGNKEYQPGEALPTKDADLAAAWVESGAAVWRGEDYEPPRYARAELVTATPGLPGLAAGGEADRDALVGRIPLTPQRQRRRAPWRGPASKP